MRRIALAVLALALLASALPAPRVAGETGDPYGGELRVALQSAPDLNPLAFSQNRLVQELAYDSLTRLGIERKIAKTIRTARKGMTNSVM